ALKSKTTLTADSQSRFLPYMALGTGVAFADWCRALCRHAALLQIAECSDEVGAPAEIAEHDESLHAAG
ncbi:unnamed protein product, partial [Effrenium voratum]